MLKYFEESQLIKSVRDTERGHGIFLESVKTILTIIVILIGVNFISVMPLIYVATNIQSDSAVIIASLFTNAFYIFAIWWIINKFQKRKMSTIGFVPQNAFNEYVRGIIVGFLMITTVLLLGWILGAFRFAGFDSNFNFGIWLLLFIGFIIQGMAEEVLCRGFILTSIARKNHVIVGIIVNSIVFAFLHISNEGFGLIPIINLIAFSVFVSLYMLLSGNIWGVSAIHTIWNFAQGAIFGLPISGTNVPSIFNFETSNIVVLNGGVFGPEGGLVVTAIMLLSIVLFIIKFKPPENNLGIEANKSISKDVKEIKQNYTTVQVINGEEREVVERCLNKPVSSKTSKKNSGKKSKKK